MRLWSLHPRYLDRQGLTAAWREALLAQAVLAGRTRGYTRHPQLERFRATPDPSAAVGAFLTGLRAEATARGYRFDGNRIDHPGEGGMPISVSAGQVAFEWGHLTAKLRARSPELAERWGDMGPEEVELHPLFVRVPGPVAPWERP